MLKLKDRYIFQNKDRYTKDSRLNKVKDTIYIYLCDSVTLQFIVDKWLLSHPMCKCHSQERYLCCYSINSCI